LTVLAKPPTLMKATLAVDLQGGQFRPLSGGSHGRARALPSFRPAGPAARDPLPFTFPRSFQEGITSLRDYGRPYPRRGQEERCREGVVSQFLMPTPPVLSPSRRDRTHQFHQFLFPLVFLAGGEGNSRYLIICFI
jgi:hypothetical protein